MPPTVDPKKYVSIKTAAAIAGVSRLYMRTMVKDGRIPGIEIDGYYFALRTACEKYERHPSNLGRPRTKPADGRS